MFERLRRDLARYFTLESKDGNPGLLEKIQIVGKFPALHAVAIYRLGSWAQRTSPPLPIWAAAKIIHRTAAALTDMMWGIHISPDADIEGGLYIGHTGAIIIGPCTIGRDCSISERVTLGRRTDGAGKSGLPTIGDRVWIGAGSVVFGEIHIGDGASIAPLTLVGRNVGPRTMVLGNPMQVLKKNHDNSLQTYGEHPIPDPVVLAADSAPAPVAAVTALGGARG
jgi:serine O-acetyltransferase